MSDYAVLDEVTDRLRETERHITDAINQAMRGLEDIPLALRLSLGSAIEVTVCGDPVPRFLYRVHIEAELPR